MQFDAQLAERGRLEAHGDGSAALIRQKRHALGGKLRARMKVGLGGGGEIGRWGFSRNSCVDRAERARTRTTASGDGLKGEGAHGASCGVGVGCRKAVDDNGGVVHALGHTRASDGTLDLGQSACNCVGLRGLLRTLLRTLLRALDSLSALEQSGQRAGFALVGVGVGVGGLLAYITGRRAVGARTGRGGRWR